MNESPPTEATAPVPVFRISFTNASLLAGGYLVVGALVELVRRQWNPRWAEQLSWSMEAFPAGILRVVGLIDPLREAYAQGTLRETHVRLIYAGSVVITVYLIGMAVGALMWLMMAIGKRRMASSS